MKHLFFLTLFLSSLFACSGDCLSCHPVLKESIDKPHHSMLNSCIQCHTKLPEGMSSCGGDCFSCHSQNELISSSNIKEHSNLSSCKQCHINKEDLFINDTLNNSSTLMDLLKNK